MNLIINLYSQYNGEIAKFLKDYFQDNSYLVNFRNNLKYEKRFDKTSDLIDFISIFIENKDKYKINLWISLDNNVFINITDTNIDEIIKYIYERFP